MLLPLFVGDLAAHARRSSTGSTAGAVVQGLAVGLLVSVLFSVVPLLEVRNVKPSLLLRQDMSSLPRFDWLKWGVAVAVGARRSSASPPGRRGRSPSVWCCPADSSRSRSCCISPAAALVRAVQPLRHARSFALRQAVLRVARPGNQTRIILLAVGLGTFFILGVRALQANLLQRLLAADGRGRAGHVPDGHPAGAARRRDGARRSRERRRRRAEADSRPARAHRRRARTRRQPRELRGRARPGRPVARVHGHLSVQPRGQREADRRQVVG